MTEINHISHDVSLDLKLEYQAGEITDQPIQINCYDDDVIVVSTCFNDVVYNGTQTSFFVYISFSWQGS